MDTKPLETDTAANLWRRVRLLETRYGGHDYVRTQDEIDTVAAAIDAGNKTKADADAIKALASPVNAPRRFQDESDSEYNSRVSVWRGTLNGEGMESTPGQTLTRTPYETDREYATRVNNA